MIAIGIGGEPGTGKSTLVRALMGLLPPGTPFAAGLLRGSGHGDIAVLGLYGDGDTYPGTDRLSMAVQADAIRFLGSGPARVALFEGDRLFNASLIRAAPEGSRFHVLEASEAIKAARRSGRADTKPPGFLKGRATKYRNILAALPGRVGTLRNETPADMERNVSILALELGLWDGHRNRTKTDGALPS